MRPLVALTLVGVGGVVGAATVVLHHEWWTLGLGVITTLVVLRALPPAWWSRLAYALGWLVVLAWTVTPRPEGDYLISADAQGYLLLGLGVVLLVTAVVTLPLPRRGARSSSPAP